MSDLTRLIIAAIHSRSRSRSFSCWLSIYESVVWSLVAPICISIIVSKLIVRMHRLAIIKYFELTFQLNLFVFFLALQASVQIKETVTDYGNLKTLLWLSIILLPLVGSVWILALLSVNDSLEELYYGFSLMSLITSIYIFVGYCLINHRVRHNITVMWARMRGHKVAYVDDSLSGTRTSVTSRSGPGFHNSSFDVLHRNIAICASSTTSRSTVTKTSSSAFRHRRRHHLNGDNSESDSDVSYDRSLDLASSHSSDEEENRSAPHQNQINAAIQQSQSVLLGANPINAPLFSRSVLSHNSEQIYGKWQPNRSVGSSQPSPITEHGPFLSSRPYSRSNILAMTAGLSSDRLAEQPIGDNGINSLNINSFSPQPMERTSRLSESVYRSIDELAQNIDTNSEMAYNIKLENRDNSKADSITEIMDNDCEVNEQNVEREKSASIQEDMALTNRAEVTAQHSSIISGVDSEAAVSPAEVAEPREPAVATEAAVVSTNSGSDSDTGSDSDSVSDSE